MKRSIKKVKGICIYAISTTTAVLPIYYALVSSKLEAIKRKIEIKTDSIGSVSYLSLYFSHSSIVKSAIKV